MSEDTQPTETKTGRGDNTDSSSSACSTVSSIREYNGKKLLKIKPTGCEFPFELPVITSGNRDKANAWTWNGSLEKPTLKPSIKRTDGITGKISHMWLNDGMCQHLGDSTDGLAGQTLPLQFL